ncbi:calcium-binding protein [Rhodobacteraceae bacterium M382]|nr:calcium-binding protein [Rhodobacteraceae bacterium M382]
MKNTAFIAAILATAGVIVAGTAHAQPGGFGKHGPKVSFEELDTDGNGEVTKTEMEAHRDARFAKADTNGDGKLTLDEMQAQARKKAEARSANMLKEFDKNGDNALSQDEMPKPRRAGKMFTHMDADGSGGISAEEFAEAKSRMGQKRGWMKGKGKDCSSN